MVCANWWSEVMTLKVDYEALWNPYITMRLALLNDLLWVGAFWVHNETTDGNRHSRHLGHLGFVIFRLYSNMLLSSDKMAWFLFRWLKHILDPFANCPSINGYGCIIHHTTAIRELLLYGIASRYCKNTLQKYFSGTAARENTYRTASCRLIIRSCLWYRHWSHLRLVEVQLFLQVLIFSSPTQVYRITDKQQKGQLHFQFFRCWMN
jgi:hypothetical protein